eukprot:TRINITY_DN2699_c0_g2_i1.p1 TRINITY_DN2699_c0_g2~~TRINITY_DN2699_c0_g2_i1.p1  ORF type:complete len:233 (-),score=44.18 TRINITY_DN2699_c0_g2_i1:29-655(-)
MTTIDVPMLFCSRPFVVQFDTCVPHQLTNRVDPHRYSQTIQGANEIYTENSYRWISLVYIVVAIALFVGMAFLIVNDSTPVFIIPTVYVAITIPFVCFEIYKRRKLYSLLGVYFATENLHYQQNGLSFIFHSHAFCGDSLIQVIDHASSMVHNMNPQQTFYSSPPYGVPYQPQQQQQPYGYNNPYLVPNTGHPSNQQGLPLLSQPYPK